MGYDRGDGFPFDFEPNIIQFGAKSKKILCEYRERETRQTLGKICQVWTNFNFDLEPNGRPFVDTI